MNKKFSLMILGLTVIFMLGAVSAFSGSGAGSSGNPYQITNCDQLQEMNNNLAANYILVNDIDCSATSTWNSGAGFVPISLFTGTFFDGQNHIITNLFINRPSVVSGSYIGLFGKITTGTEIKNVGLVNVKITGDYMVGGLVAYMEYSGAIIHSYVTGSVTGNNYVGGLVGQSYFGTITNSYATDSVTASDHPVGGLVGENMGAITNCYATGRVTGSSMVGGLIGNNYIDWLHTHYGTVTSSYWDTQTSGQSTSADGIGKTTAEMKTQSTFVGWDFTHIWSINSHENNGYPYFSVEPTSVVPEFGLIAGITTVLGALGVFFIVRKK
jgi:hypothetical protein